MSTEPALLIRPFAVGDAARVAALTLAGFDRYGRIDGPYRQELADPSTRRAGATALLVAELAGEVVGTVTFVLPGDTEWFGRPEPEGDAGFRVLAVAPEAEGRGVGRALVLACLDLAREHGCHRVAIVTMDWMGRARDMYERLGFVRRPDLDVRFPSGLGLVLTYDLTGEATERFPPPGPVPSVPPWYTEVWAD